MTAPAAPAAPAIMPPEPLPDRCRVYLNHYDLRHFTAGFPADLQAGFPADLQSGFSWFGEVTPDQYRTLTGDQEGARLKLCLAVHTEDPESGRGVYIHAADLLTQEQGYCALQTQLIRHLVDQDSRGARPEYWERCRPQGNEPRNDAEWQEVAKPLEDLSYPALQFLLYLADVYSPDAFDISRENFDEALRQYPTVMNLADFVRPETMDL